MNALENTDSDIGFNIPNSYYEFQNQFCEPNIKKVQVWIETQRDFNFWNSILEGKISNTEFNIQSTETFVEDGKVGTGCSRILYLVSKGNIELGKNSIVCIDSDYYCISKLMNSSFDHSTQFHTAIDIITDYSKNFVFRTLIHSKECAFYIERFIREEIRKCICVSNIDEIKICFSEILSEISKTIKFYFIFILKIHNENKITLDERNKILKSLLEEISIIKQIPISYFEDVNSFVESPIFISFKEKIEILHSTLISQHSEANENIEILIKNIESFSINDSNLFYFLRGHDVAEILKGIANSYIKAIKNDHQSLLESELASKGCDENSIKTMRTDVMGSYRNNIQPGIFDTNYQNIHQNEYIKIVFDCIKDCISTP
ncbi:hypothetical protein F935_01204 [Acinetobacter calcoaceticus ANC 3811]|uniref:DUF4435 domain-containing protein n=1 Tax=Acinetobacter calcoaceticus ANC 3811 TaxID=1217690 RepID=R8Y2A5_ACICA|nr:hypothetical protein [Acinetobacter calcoaceticus]EOQ63575.1 hypothetical protein F935_01204 [Acinetobacter calcoaceticus ANC 3811]